MELQERKTHSFFKGISLSQYMKEIPCPEDIESEGDNQDTSDLYMQCEPTANIADCAIREIMDEENYDESSEKQELIVRPFHNLDLQRARVVQGEELKKAKPNPFRKPAFHQNRNNSNSPLKQIVSPKKQMFKSLYGHSFGGAGGDGKTQRGHLLSTLGMNNWRGKNKSLSKKQAQQRDKNKRQYQELIKYESVITQRLDSKLNSIRVDGIRDKIHDRNQRSTQRDGRI